MRICYVADGASIHTQRWLNYFAQKGHEVHLICWKAMSGYDNSIRIHLLTRLAPKIWAASQYLSFLFWIIQVRRLIRRIKPDIVDGHFITVYGFLAACSGFHPLVLTAWGSDVLVAPKNSIIGRFTVRFALRKANLTLTTSQYLRGYLHREFGLPQDRIRAIPWGVNLKIFHQGYETEVNELRAELGTGDSNFVILSPRHMRDNYRIEYIVQAVPYIVAKYPNVIVILLKGAAQDSEYESKIDNLSMELGMAQNIRVIRRELRPQEMAVLYNASNALISIPKADQFAACIQEGMACGVIPIVADLEVSHQYLTDGENALFVNPEDPEQIAQKIIYCVEHPELKERFYEINRKIIEEKEDWDKNARKMEELYISLTQESSWE